MKQNQQLKLTIDLNENPDLGYLIEKFSELSIDTAYDLANRLKERGYYKDAIAIYELMVNSAPELVMVTIELADLLFETGCDKKAQKLYESLIYEQNIDEQPQLKHNLGLIYWRQGKKEQAVKLWEQAIRKKTGFYASYDALIYHTKKNGNQQQVKSLIRRRKIAQDYAAKSLQDTMETLNFVQEIQEGGSSNNWLQRLFNNIFGI
ncbi:MAG: tetratricopeptide repeat protein [Atribacterota bacterium]